MALSNCVCVGAERVRANENLHLLAHAINENGVVACGCALAPAVLQCRYYAQCVFVYVCVYVCSSGNVQAVYDSKRKRNAHTWFPHDSAENRHVQCERTVQIGAHDPPICIPVYNNGLHQCCNGDILINIIWIHCTTKKPFRNQPICLIIAHNLHACWKLWSFVFSEYGIVKPPPA